MKILFCGTGLFLLLEEKHWDTVSWADRSYPPIDSYGWYIIWSSLLKKKKESQKTWKSYYSAKCALEGSRDGSGTFFHNWKHSMCIDKPDVGKKGRHWDSLV